MTDRTQGNGHLPRQFPANEHHTMYRWADPEGHEWACCAYDHGPFCRLCQPVDETLAALLVNVEEGLLLARCDASGVMSFQVTATGKAKAADLLTTLAMEDQFDE